MIEIAESTLVKLQIGHLINCEFNVTGISRKANYTLELNHNTSNIGLEITIYFVPFHNRL